MVPTAEQTAANRQLLAGAIRMAAVIFIAIALYIWAYQIEAALYYHFSGYGNIGSSTSNLAAVLWEMTYWAPLLLVAVAVVFLRFPDHFARLCVRMPKSTACPSCGYMLDEITKPNCPECGLRLTQAFVVEKETPATKHDN